MINGINAIILDIDEAKQLLKALQIAYPGDKWDYKFFQKHKVINAISDLEHSIRDMENRD